MAADWFLDYIVVTNATMGTRAKFPFHNWFDSKNGWAHTLSPEGMEADTVSAVDFCESRAFQYAMSVNIWLLVSAHRIPVPQLV